MTPVPIHPQDTRAVLVILPTWVGDFVMATPALRSIRRHFADARITFLMESNLRDLVDGGDWMDDCVQWPARRHCSLIHRPYRRMIGALRRRRFDAAILLPNSFRAAMVAWLGGSRRIVGYHRDGRGLLLTDRVAVTNLRDSSTVRSGHPTKSENGAVVVGGNLPVRPSRYVPMRLVDYYADMLAHIGCPRPEDAFELFTTPTCDESVTDRLASLGVGADESIAVISPGAKFGASKCWAADRFAAVADRLVENVGMRVLVTCGPGEEHMAVEIRNAMKQPGIAILDPGLSLGELKSLIRRASLLLCTDSGPRHIGKAFGIPVVTVFGPTHPEWTATNYADERIVRINVDCGPCQQRTCPPGHHECMKGVTIDAVYAAARELLDRQGDAASTATVER